MLRHQFSQNLIFSLDLLLQILDAFLFSLVIGPVLLLQSSGPVFEEVLLPAVEHRRMQPMLFA